MKSGRKSRLFNSFQWFSCRFDSKSVPRKVDAFLKMPRPDSEASGLGTSRLDEPTLNPSDPSILDLQLRSLSKNQDLQPMEALNPS